MHDARNRRLIAIYGDPGDHRAAEEAIDTVTSHFHGGASCKAALNCFLKMAQGYTKPQLENVVRYGSPEVVKRKKYQRGQ